MINLGWRKCKSVSLGRIALVLSHHGTRDVSARSAVCPKARKHFHSLIFMLVRNNTEPLVVSRTFFCPNVLAQAVQRPHETHSNVVDMILSVYYVRSISISQY